MPARPANAEQQEAAPEQPERLGYLARFAEHVSKTSAKLKNELVSKNSDCGAYATVSTDLYHMDQILLASIRNVYFGHDFELLKREYQVSGSRPTMLDAQEARSHLYAAVLQYESLFQHMYRIAGKEHRLFDNCMVLVFMIDMYQYGLIHSLRSAKPMDEYIAEKQPWLCFYNVAYSTRQPGISDYSTPVLQYRVSELMHAVYQLAARWNHLPYVRVLLDYCELLRVRIGQILTLSFGNKVHDVAALRHGKDEITMETPDGEFQCTSLFMYSLAPVFADIGRDLCNYSSIPQATAQEALETFGNPRNWSRLVRRFSQWLNEKCDAMIPDGPSDYMGKYLLNMSLRPGEKKVYARDTGTQGGMMDAQYVMGRYRKPEFWFLSDLKQNTFSEIIQRNKPQQTKALLRRLRTPGFVPGDAASIENLPLPKNMKDLEPQEYMLCLMELMEMYTKATFFKLMNLTDHIILESELTKRISDLTHTDRPFVIQLFHFFQVAYKGKLYRFDSLVLAWIGLMKILEKDFNKTVNMDGSSNCDISEWYRDLLGPILPARGTRTMYEPHVVPGAPQLEPQQDPYDSDASDEEDEDAQKSKDKAEQDQVQAATLAAEAAVVVPMDDNTLASVI